MFDAIREAINKVENEYNKWSDATGKVPELKEKIAELQKELDEASNSTNAEKDAVVTSIKELKELIDQLAASIT